MDLLDPPLDGLTSSLSLTFSAASGSALRTLLFLSLFGSALSVPLGSALPSLLGLALPSLLGLALLFLVGSVLPSLLGVALPSLLGSTLPSLLRLALPSLLGSALPSLLGSALPSLLGSVLPSLLGSVLPSLLVSFPVPARARLRSMSCFSRGFPLGAADITTGLLGSDVLGTATSSESFAASLPFFSWKLPANERKTKETGPGNQKKTRGKKACVIMPQT